MVSCGDPHMARYRGEQPQKEARNGACWGWSVFALPPMAGADWLALPNRGNTVPQIPVCDWLALPK